MTARTLKWRRERVDRLLREIAAKDFRSGDPTALIDRFESLVQRGVPLTEDEAQLIVGALYATRSEDTAKCDREWDLAFEIEGYLAEGKCKSVKDAIGEAGIDPATGKYRPGMSARTLKRALAKLRALADKN